ncbi:MAG: alcohol dehydrogenase catalytic domain-containing protein, partial [Gemmataceae bacterium]|nr:alcohol dehydrogenase catalytic domain-containing protein [Gemmataceae bacterium]
MPKSLTCVKTGEHEVAMAEVSYPDEPGPGQALIRTRLASICGSDIHIVDELPVPAGVPLGHEAVGTVVAVGAGVTFRPGERVVTSCLL